MSGTALFAIGLLTTHVAGLTSLTAGVTASSWPLTALGAAVTATYPVKVTLHAVRDRHRRWDAYTYEGTGNDVVVGLLVFVMAVVSAVTTFQERKQ